MKNDLTTAAVLASLAYLETQGYKITNGHGQPALPAGFAEEHLAGAAGAMTAELGHRDLLEVLEVTVQILKYRARCSRNPNEERQASKTWKVLDYRVRRALGEIPSCWSCPDHNRAKKPADHPAGRFCRACQPLVLEAERVLKVAVDYTVEKVSLVGPLEKYQGQVEEWIQSLRESPGAEIFERATDQTSEHLYDVCADLVKAGAADYFAGPAHQLIRLRFMQAVEVIRQDGLRQAELSTGAIVPTAPSSE